MKPKLINSGWRVINVKRIVFIFLFFVFFCGKQRNNRRRLWMQKSHTSLNSRWVAKWVARTRKPSNWPWRHSDWLTGLILRIDGDTSCWIHLIPWQCLVIWAMLTSLRWGFHHGTQMLSPRPTPDYGPLISIVVFEQWHLQSRWEIGIKHSNLTIELNLNTSTIKWLD